MEEFLGAIPGQGGTPLRESGRSYIIYVQFNGSKCAYKWNGGKAKSRLQTGRTDLVRCIVTRKRPALFRGRRFEDVIILLCVRWYPVPAADRSFWLRKYSRLGNGLGD
jgi:hypothetical protein